jgi:ABC-type nickel/cobalt efflux system permease component RcnA
MKTPQEIQDSIAAAGASTSVLTAVAAKATEFQPIISAMSGLIAIITGLFAIVYYMKKLNRIDGQADSNSKNTNE